ncbi:Trm112 family protein [Streptomyces sp. XM4193]|uniref:Trm112 family protein n=1 Tax=Streptomyces sp. XM4193 TaxID=2929782 RepID=UPI001FF9A80B|nr:Trm112 family protein [Streptomyces sp. XM4193]MCK1796987.1 Trm112 family protein [Streptomyces sp. XM4193]
MPLEAGLLEILACPACHAALREEPAEASADDKDEPGTELRCTAEAGCGLVYPVRDGIPVLLVDEARRPG